MGGMNDSTATGSRDILRQIAVISATVFMLIAAVVGVGLLGGTPVQDLQGGALSADATVLAPATQAFQIWSVIYLGLIAYAIWQALPSQRSTQRQRALGWWVALAAVLNGVWLLVAQFLTLPLTVLAIVVLLFALAMTFVRTLRIPTTGRVDALLLDGVTGLHLGWVALATVANTTAWLATVVPEQDAGAQDAWGVAVLVVVAMIGALLGWRSGGRIAPALAMSWGLSWIAVGRLTDTPSSTVVGIAAIAAAVVILVVTIARRAQRARSASATQRA